MTDLKTIAAYDAQVDSYLGMIDQQPIDPQLLDFIARLKAGGFVLDLGCGPAKASAVMRDHGLRVDPIDASLEMVKLANDRFSIGARQAVFEDIKTKATYDGIWANFSLLHAAAKDLPNILKALHQALKPQGVFHLGMKTGSGSARDKLDRYYTYYSQEQLTNHLADAGFVVEHAELGEAKGLAGDMEPWVVLTSRHQN
jgi:SAM-dependent methyltransferase